MVQFRNAVAGTSMDNYYNDGGAVAFSRGNKGFFAMAKNGNFQKTLATGNKTDQQIHIFVFKIMQFSYSNVRFTCWHLLQHN